MSVVIVVQPKLAVRCDHCGAEDEVTVDWLDGWSTRRAAERRGWRVRPARGPGSKSAPDVCPRCQRKIV